jgi:hypothetical protein
MAIVRMTLVQRTIEIKRSADQHQVPAPHVDIPLDGRGFAT